MDDEIHVPSPDGAVVYTFNQDGVHQRTNSAVLGTTIRQFGYTEQGRLSSITDALGSEVRLERSGDALTGIVNPYDDTTTFSPTGENLLSSSTDPANQTVSSVWNSESMLANVSTTISTTSAEYDAGHGGDIKQSDGEGALRMLTGPTGSNATVSHQATGNSESLSFKTGFDRETYSVATKVDDATSQIATRRADELTVHSTLHGDDWTTTYPNGMKVEGSVAKHPKFGDQAPYVDSVTVTTPSGLARSVSIRRKLEPIDAPLVVQARRRSMASRGRRRSTYLRA